jgi:hypothetical protein
MHRRQHGSVVTLRKSAECTIDRGDLSMSMRLWMDFLSGVNSRVLLPSVSHLAVALEKGHVVDGGLDPEH